MYFGFRFKHYFQINSLVKKNNIFFDIIIDLQSKLRIVESNLNYYYELYILNPIKYRQSSAFLLLSYYYLI